MRPRAASILLAVCACMLAGCSGGSAQHAATLTPDVTATPAVTLAVFRGFTYPIAGGCLPQSDNLMPNAPRVYREGTHEGVDFYQVDNCTPITKGTPVLAAKDGVVVRADHGYHDLTQAELDAADARIAAGHPNDDDILDLFRGRQVWVDHGGGIITRYAHLSAIPDNIQPGVHVLQGEAIAAVGNSGTPESISDPTAEMHLHFEVRAADAYLGNGAPPDEVRALYLNLFTPLAP